VASRLDSQIDELYQLPLEQFTDRRNALAKELSGSAKTQVRRLIKPSLAMWAINQLYWQERPTHSALVDASEKVRAAHRALLSGHKTDVRKPEQVHRSAIERAHAKTINILSRNGLRASSSVLDTIRRSLAALPTDEPNGRLTRPPEPSGFTLLTGVKPQVVREPKATAPPDVPAERKRKEAEERRQEERQREERRQEERAERAKQFARAQAARKLERAKREAEESASRLEAAQRRLAELEKD
jgi:regulator of protease activity HflC (stomatin/prohibitin superfamily)